MSRLGKIFTVTIATCSVLTMSGIAAAGFRSAYQVQVNTDTRQAWGSLGTARASSDSNQYISCSVYGYSSSAGSARCEARTATNVRATCYSSNPSIIQAIAALDGDGYVLFNWDTSGSCTYVATSSGSLWAPKAP